MGVYLGQGEGKELVKKVASVYNFEILKQKGGPVIRTYIIDLKNG